MTFNEFAKTLKEKRQDVYKIIIMGEGVYIQLSDGLPGHIYKGTYCEILNKLKINAIYKRDLEQLQDSLKKDIHALNNPQEWDDFFSTFEEALPFLRKEIERKTDAINFYAKNFVLCDG